MQIQPTRQGLPVIFVCVRDIVIRFSIVPFPVLTIAVLKSVNVSEY
ncbi:MAG: hypothetical protein RLZZ203_1148 [Cyanobacteriota bacterium]|jgi:hypothetical protein